MNIFHHEVLLTIQMTARNHTKGLTGYHFLSQLSIVAIPDPAGHQ
nr:hypothetical protein [Prevotella sp.]